MKPVLVLALGNPLAGADGTGEVVLRRLSADPEVVRRADLISAGTDLFRQADALAGRERVVLVDAALHGGGAARVRALPHARPGAELRAGAHAHALDPVLALELLRTLHAEIATAETWWLLVDVPEITLGDGLSPQVAALVPEAVQRVRELVLAPVRART